MPTIRFYPFNEGTKSFVPRPQPAARYVPEWYKIQPGNKGDEEMIPKGGLAASTVKRCMPIFDAMTAGYMIVAPCDIHLDATNPEKLEWQIPAQLQQFKADLFATHAPEQYENYPIDPESYHKQLLRILPTWSVGTDEGYSVLFTNPYHTDGSPLWAFTGLIDTDKFISEGHVSFLVKKGFKGIIKQGTPLYQLIPVKREEWVAEYVSVEESNAATTKQRFDLRSTFMNGYKNKFRSKKVYK
ncbi:MAG: hypothetical protein WAO41_08750 [Candidatus Nanopelagicales bacterium]